MALVAEKSEISDLRFMWEALRLARRGLGLTSPNPAVGAVVAKGGKIVGRGYHRQVGGPHAEVVALQQAGELARGADLYVTLEPCCHFGRTPPCVEAIIGAGIKRVFAAWQDPNPRVDGQGIARLRGAGLEVHLGLLEAQAKGLNEAHHKFVTTGLPLVTLKLACSLDGKIATREGESRWITGERARRFVHRLRAWHDAVLVGAATVLADDPELTVRLGRGKQPRRVVADSRGRIPPTARILTSSDPPPIVATTPLCLLEKREKLVETGAEVLVLPEREGKVDLAALLRALGEREITSLLVEGGGKLAAGLLEAGLVDKAWFILAPIIIGGENAPGAVAGKGVAHLSEAWRLKRVRLRRLGEDLAIGGYLPSSPLA